MPAVSKTVRRLRGVRGDGGSLDAALEEIMKTPPTTPAGARAFIEHVVEWDKDGVLEANGRYLARLLRSPLLAP
jgi:hypothetical protein